MLCWFLPSNKRIKHKYTYITSLLSLPLPPAHHPTPLDCHRAPGWAPCVIQQLPTYFTDSNVYILMLLESGFKWRFLGPPLQACESVCGGWAPGVSNVSGQQHCEPFWTSDLLEGKTFSSPIFSFFLTIQSHKSGNSQKNCCKKATYFQIVHPRLKVSNWRFPSK